jgi:TolA-binding protein
LADYSSATAAAAAAAAAASGPAGGEASNAAGDADSAAAAAAALTGLLQSDPLSPGGGVSSNSGQFVHELFRNPYLNAHVSNFSAHSFDAEARRLMQERGPIGSYHTVRSSTSSPLLFRLSALQCGIPRAFFDMYAAALELYLDGEWPSARQALLEAQRLYPEDGPTKVLLDVMKAHHYVAPTDWAGWHEV